MSKTLKLKYLTLAAGLTPTILSSAVAFVILKNNTAALTSALFAGLVAGIVGAVICSVIVSSRVRRSIEASVECVAATAAEIAGTVDQRERLASQQAAAANETTAA